MSLEVEVNGRNMDVTERIKDYVVKKVARLDRFRNTSAPVRSVAGRSFPRTGMAPGHELNEGFLSWNNRA